MEFADLFALSNDGLGKTNISQDEIHNGNYPLIHQQFRKVCPQKRQEMRVFCMRCWRGILLNLLVAHGHHQ